MCRLRVVAQEIGFSDKGVEYSREMSRKSSGRGKQVRNCFIKGLRILQELLRSGLESSEPPAIVVELWIGRF
jgi:hypothetical protein